MPGRLVFLEAASFGGPDNFRLGGCALKTVLYDIRFAWRQLIKMPGFTVTAIVSLALGIGATTAVFSVVYAILMDPYPYTAPDRMVHTDLIMTDGHSREFIGITRPEWQQLRKSQVVEDSFLQGSRNMTISGSEFPEDVLVVDLSSNAFNFLGVPAALGRTLEPSDAIDGQDPAPVVVLGYKFWQRHFNGDTSVIGKTLQLDHQNYTVVGVAGERFAWGDGDFYLPLKITGDQTTAYYVCTRLKPGITHAQADAALQPLYDGFARETPKVFPAGKLRVHVVGLNEQFVKDLGGTLYLLFGAVALLLLIGCGNVSILLLARATGRQHEFAIRAAIGASRSRIIRQLLTEALLLSITGAVLGLALAYKTTAVIAANLPEFSFPHEAAIQINVPVLIFCVAIAVGTGVLFGLWPAWQLSRPEVSQVMQSNTRKTTGDVRGRKTHAVLIGGQIALTLLMLSGAGAAIDGFLRLAHMKLGYDPHNVMSVGIPVHDGAYNTWAERAPYFEQLYARVAQVPGVRMAGISSNATPPENGFNTKFEIVGKPSEQDQTLKFNMVSKEYFPVLRIPVIQGRLWDEDETKRGAALALVNQAFVKRYFPAGDAIGHTVTLPELKPPPPFVKLAPGTENGFLIVGVVGDKLDDGLSKPILPEIFVPYTAVATGFTQILVRSDGPPLALLHSIRSAITTVDPSQQTINNVRDLEHWISTMPEYARGQLVAWLFGAFAFLALALAAVGLYSVVAYTAVQRTNEFGIRIALGADRGHVLGLVFRSTAASVGAGIVAGVILTLALNKVMAAWAAESVRDPMLLLGATIALSVVATLACLVPAWRAAGADPMKAIRYE